MSIAALSNLSASLHRKTVAGDASGGSTSSGWAAVGSSFTCALQPLGQQRQELFGKLSIIATHVLFCESLVAVQNGDRIHVGSDRYEYASHEDMGGRGRAYAYYLRRVTG